MSSTRWILLILCIGLPRLSSGDAEAVRVVVGIASPMGQLAQSPERAESLRQVLVTQLRARSIEAIPLSANGGGPLQEEAQAKGCSYVLYTRLDKKHGVSGLFGKLSALTGSGGQQSIAPGGGTAAPGFQRGDTVTLDYRLLAVGSTDPVKADTFARKADADGPEVVAALVAQLAGSVAAATASRAAPGGGAGAGTATATSSAGASGDPAASTPPRAPPPWSRNQRTVAPSTAAAGAGGMDCARLAAMPGAMMTLESCQQLQAAQRTYDQSASVPGAARPGDEQMTCAEIAAELKEQSFKAPDQSQLAAAQATAAQVDANRRQAAETMLKEKAESQAAVSAASAADTAVEVASLGMVRGHALEATEKAVDARHRATNERLDKDNQAVARQTFGQMGDLASDAGGQLQANPRLARLMQLANARHCRNTG